MATETTATTLLKNANMAMAPKHINTEDDIQTEVYYLIKDAKYESERPYDMRYNNGGVIPQTNMSNEFKPILVHNFRSLQTPKSFKEYGFLSTKIDCALTISEFEDEKKVVEVYWPEIEKILWQNFPDAAEIGILEHIIRKRDPRFHAGTEESFKTLQPATSVHIDFSLHSAARSAEAFDIAPDHHRRLLTVNFWKSLHGPGNDWPLALCDWRTVDRSSESIIADVVYHNRFTENERLYYSPKHKWYYFKDLGDDEVIMFRQTDSDIEGGGGGVPHTSFYNPRADQNAAPRVSIELRAFVFFA